MNLPIVLSHEVNAPADSGGADPAYIFFEELAEQLTWTLTQSSSIATAQEMGEDRERDIVWETHQAGNISTESTTPYWLSFKAPQPGLIKIVRKWTDRFLFVFIPSNATSWFISSSEPSNAFKRMHGNALVIDADFTINHVQNIIRNCIRAWLRLDHPGIIITANENYSTSRREEAHLISRSDLELLFPTDGTTKTVEERRRLAAKLSFSKTHDNADTHPFLDTMFMPDQNFVLPAPWQSTSNREIAIPLLSFGARSTRPTIKIGHADIYFNPTTSQYRFNDKWTWMESNKILPRIEPARSGITALSSGNKLFAWYPLAPPLFSPNRIKAVGSGFFSLLNPSQSIQVTGEQTISPTTMFCSADNPVTIETNIASTNWNRRELNSNKSPIHAAFTPVTDSRNAPVSPNTSANISVADQNAAYIQIRSSVSGNNLYISIPQRRQFSIERFRLDLVEICNNEYTFWNVTHPHAQETSGGDIRDRLADYWKNGAGTPSGGLGVNNSFLGIADWQAGKNGYAAHPWSATFISWSIRQALNRQGIPRNQHRRFFQHSASHINYIRWAKDGRVNNKLEQVYWLYGLNEVNIEIGDIIAKNRDGGIYSYDNLSGGDNLSHTDIVTEVLNDRIIVIGGNILQNVDKKTIFFRSEHDRHIDLSKKFYEGPAFTGAYPAVPSPTRPLSDPHWSDSNFFAIMKLRRGIL